MKLACPNCGSDVVYVVRSSNVFCSHCNKETPIKVANEYLKNMINNSENIDTFANKCSSCGAVILTTSEDIVSICNYCGSQNITKSRYTKELNKRLVIPFRCSKEEVINKYKNIMASKVHTNVDFFNESTIKKITGSYIPMTQIHTKGEVYTRCRLRGGDEDVSYASSTNFFEIKSNFELKINIDNSNEFLDEFFYKIGKYDVAFAEPFSPYYMAGYSTLESTDSYDNEIKKATHSVLQKLSHNYFDKAKDNQLIRSDYKDATFYESIVSYETLERTCYYVPVWVCSYAHKGKLYSFIVNGQSGKTLYNFPLDKSKISEEEKFDYANFIYFISIWVAFIFVFLLGALSNFNIKSINQSDIFGFIVLIILLLSPFLLLLSSIKEAKEYKRKTLNNMIGNDTDMVNVIESNYSLFKETKLTKQEKKQNMIVVELDGIELE